MIGKLIKSINWYIVLSYFIAILLGNFMQMFSNTLRLYNATNQGILVFAGKPYHVIPWEVEP